MAVAVRAGLCVADAGPIWFPQPRYLCSTASSYLASPFRHTRACRGHLAEFCTESRVVSFRHSCAGRNPRSGRGSLSLQTFGGGAEPQAGRHSVAAHTGAGDRLDSCLCRNDGKRCAGLGRRERAWCSPRRDTRGKRGYDGSLLRGGFLLAGFRHLAPPARTGRLAGVTLRRNSRRKATA